MIKIVFFKNIKKLIYFYFILFLIFLNCSKQEEKEVIREPVIDKDEEYVFVAVSSSVSYWVDAKKGLKDIEMQLGVKTTFTGPKGADPMQQVNILEQVAARRPAGIIVVPAEPEALKNSINKIVDSGIPVICQDTDSPDSKRYTFIGTGNYQAGYMGGTILAEEIEGKGKVLLISIPGQWNLDERVKGYKDALSKFKEIEIVRIENDKAQTNIAASITAQVLIRYPDLAGIGCMDAIGGLGAGRAVKEAGKAGKIKIVAMDRDEATLDLIEEGIITASIGQRTYLMSYLSVLLLYNLVHNNVRMIQDWKKAGVVPLPPLIDTGSFIITKDNVKNFRH